MGKIFPYLGLFGNELFEKLYLEKSRIFKGYTFLYIKKKKNCSLICTPKQTCHNLGKKMPQSRKLHGRHFVGPVYLRSILDWFYQMYFVALMGHFKTSHPTFSPHTKTKKCEELWTQKNVKLGWALMYFFHFLIDLPFCLSQASLKS